MTRRWVRALACMALAASAMAARATDFVVLVQDQPAGHMKVTADVGGRTEVDYSYRDNGRGPNMRESFRLDAHGQPVAYEIKGKATFGAEVHETFQLANGRARWRSRADDGDEAATEDFVFLPMDATAAYSDAMLRFMLSRPGASVPTLKGLRLVAERALQLKLQLGATEVPVALVVVTGGDAQPWYFWVRDDASNALLAITYPGWALVEKGFEPLVAGLTERQQKAQTERLVTLRQRLAQPIEGLSLIRAVRWFDAPAARMRGPSDVWLFDGRIAAVTAPGALTAVPDRVVDGAKRSLLPGLWDMHAHTWPDEGLQHLAAGVTSVRDQGNQNEDLLRAKGQIERGEIAGPSIFPSGFIEGKSPFSSRSGIVVDGLDAGLKAVDWYAARGYAAIKLYNSIKPEWVKPLAARAHAQGLRVTGHVPAFMRAKDVIRAGYDEITHINQAMLNFVVRPSDDTRTLLRFERVGADGSTLNLRSAKAKAFIALMRQRGTTFDPTLGAFESMYTQAQGQANPSLLDVADHLPVLWQRGLRVTEIDLEGKRLADFRGSWQRMLELTQALHKAGVPLVAGTDALSGLGLHRELALYVKAGIPAPEALRIATFNGAVYAGQSATRGRIERGYVADLVLIDGDPSVNIADLRRASLVIQGKVAYLPDRLYESMGYKPFVPGAAWQP